VILPLQRAGAGVKIVVARGFRACVIIPSLCHSRIFLSGIQYYFIVFLYTSLFILNCNTGSLTVGKINRDNSNRFKLVTMLQRSNGQNFTLPLSNSVDRSV